MADITGVKLTNPSFNQVQIYVSDDKDNWTLVKEDSLKTGEENKLYFSQIVNDELENNKSLVSYSSSYIKIVAVDENDISLSEIDVLGPTGDNIDMSQENSIGILSGDYKLDANNTIPKGSLIFTGTYAENGKIIENSFGYQDDEGNFVKVELPGSIKPELYRVNDAQTNAGQRLVSDSFEVKIPTELPSITIGNQKRGGK